MIDFESWPVALKLSFLIAPCVISLSGVAISAHIALSRDYEIAMSSVTSHLYLERMKAYWGGVSLKSRCLLLGALGGVIVSAGLQERWGLLDGDEIRKFPPSLKRRILVSTWLSVAGFVWLMLGYLLLKP